MNITKWILFLCIIILAVKKSPAQDIDSLLSEADNTSTDYTSATFKSTRIINGHSIERMQAGQLDVRFSHRFGSIDEGAYTLWGLDEASIYFSGEYGITNWLMAGLGRDTYDKTYDGFLKFSCLRQSKGARTMPVSVSFLLETSVITLNPDALLGVPDQSVEFWNRVSYIYQVLVARKFTESFSFEINPTLIHSNLVLNESIPNDVFALGVGGRMKISKHVSFNGEWYHIFQPSDIPTSDKIYDPLSFGFDIETGGHVFQLMVTNSLAMTEKGFITETTGQWSKTNIHLGFNISRVFALKGSK